MTIIRKVKLKTELQQHIDRLVHEHGSLRAAARALGFDPPYLWRLRKGFKANPSDKTLKKLGLRREETLRPL